MVGKIGMVVSHSVLLWTSCFCFQSKAPTDHKKFLIEVRTFSTDGTTYYNSQIRTGYSICFGGGISNKEYVQFLKRKGYKHFFSKLSGT